MAKPTETKQTEPVIEQTPLVEEPPTEQPTTSSSLDPLTQMTELAKRTQANFENYRKQTEKRIEDIRQFASKECIMQLLPIIDNFKLAIETAEKQSAQNPSNSSQQTQDLLKGIELIYAQLHEVLEKNGVKPIETINQKFNPHLHEALMKIPSDLPENTIIEEFQSGYIMYERVIRTARVKISNGKKA
jgi:molecular chaperone GrpE